MLSVHHFLRTNRKLDFVHIVLAMASVLLKCYRHVSYVCA